MKMLICLTLLALAAHAKASGPCSIHTNYSRFGNEMIFKALEHKGYQFVDESSKAALELESYGMAFASGGNDDLNDVVEEITFFDNLAHQAITITGEDTGLVFSAHQSTALKRALRKVPSCKQ